MGSSDEFVRGQRSLSGKTREIRGNLSEVMITPAMPPCEVYNFINMSLTLYPGNAIAAETFVPDSPDFNFDQ